MPERNRKDLQEVPEQARKEIEFIFATQMDDVLKDTLEQNPFNLPPPPADGGPTDEKKPPAAKREAEIRV